MNDKIATKIRALLAKTEASGCTTDEAIAAAMKARELMDRYGIEDPFEEQIDPYGSRTNPVREGLCGAVAKFCSCACYGTSGKITFHGYQSDTIFADWLLSQLESFVSRETMAYAANARHGTTGDAVRAFSLGCCNRIADRLRAASRPSSAKEIAIREDMQGRGIVIAKTRCRTVNVRSGNALHAGRAAGDMARFDRPVSEGRAPLRLSH